jgi:hypothetical protein
MTKIIRIYVEGGVVVDQEIPEDCRLEIYDYDLCEDGSGEDLKGRECNVMIFEPEKSKE